MVALAEFRGPLGTLDHGPDQASSALADSRRHGCRSSRHARRPSPEGISRYDARDQLGPASSRDRTITGSGHNGQMPGSRETLEGP
jgi:hypothetical protein